MLFLCIFFEMSRYARHNNAPLWSREATQANYVSFVIPNAVRNLMAWHCVFFEMSRYARHDSA